MPFWEAFPYIITGMSLGMNLVILIRMRRRPVDPKKGE